MMSPKRYVLLLLWVAVFFVFIWLRLGDALSDRYFQKVLASKLEDNTPAGEVAAGFHLQQPINCNLLDKGVMQQDASSVVCVSVFLANYSNRDNYGTFALSLQVGANQYRTVAEAKTVRDNAYQRVCFENVVFGDIVHKPTSIILEGIDSPPGRAITAWMTKDIVHGGAVLRDGTVSDRSLTFSIEAMRSGSKKRLHAIILMLICGLSSALIFLAASSRTENRLSKKPDINPTKG